jgi:hypothetical protein
MTEAVFIEYTYNPYQVDHVKIFSRLDTLGFVCRSKHSVSSIEVWVQNRAVLFIRADITVTTGSVTGLGILADADVIDQCPDAVYDQDTDFYVIHNDQNTFRLYLVESTKLDMHYQNVNPNYVTPHGINAFSGLELAMPVDHILPLLTSIPVKQSVSEYYTRLLFTNKFTVLVPHHVSGNSKVIAECADVFMTTSRFAFKQVQMLKFAECSEAGFGSLSHKIVGYNCKAFGTPDSYSIENYVIGQTLNLDIIFRHRHRSHKIKEETLLYYDSIR